MSIDDKPEAVAETWLFAGTRVTSTGTKCHAWLPLPARGTDDELLYTGNGSFTVGSDYDVKVKREPDHIWKVGTPTYSGRHEDSDVRALVEARHKAAEAVLRVKRMERADRRDSALEEALEPLVKLSAGLHPTARTAFVAYVIQKITKPW